MGDGPHAVILAAGQGKRMRSALPKVLHTVGGRPLIVSVIDAVTAATGTTPIVVIARGDTAVRAVVGDSASCVEQDAPRGTGDALRSVPDPLRDPGPVLVVHGDAPLIRPETLQRMLAAHASSPRSCTLLVAAPADPSGMGRVIRDTEGHVLRIVEEADLIAGEPVPMECNAGVYVFTGSELWPALDRLDTGNAQGEYYLRRRRSPHRACRGSGCRRSRRGARDQRPPPARCRRGGAPPPHPRRAHARGRHLRSEERRVGKECV